MGLSSTIRLFTIIPLLYNQSIRLFISLIQVNVQFKVVDYVNSILSLYTVGVLEPIPASYDLFKTLISVISVAGDEDVVVKVR